MRSGTGMVLSVGIVSPFQNSSGWMSGRSLVLSCTFRSEFRKNSDSVGISGKIRRNMFPIGKEIVCTYVRQKSSFSDCVQTVPWVT